MCRMSSSEIPPSCIDRFVAEVTAEMAAARNPLKYDTICILKQGKGDKIRNRDIENILNLVDGNPDSTT